jgi:predicted amidohydrolase|tara:strand:- start:12 stop:803 length:792 start_codon:yes stop_codon:yes gene_type:complete
VIDLKITLIQSDLYWENIEANLAHFEEKIWDISGETDLIILPEMFSTGFTTNAEKLSEPPHSKTFRWMVQMANQKKAVIMGSYIVKEKNNYFNRLYAMYPEGKYGQYDKKHLFALGGEQAFFEPGVEKSIITIKGWKICPLICYDLRFPAWSRSRSNGPDLYEYDLLIYVASWPKMRINAWDTLLSARAIENQSYCVGVNRTGIDGNGLEYLGHSGVYDFLGDRQADLGTSVTTSTTVLSKESLDLFRSKLPFQKEADSFNFL